MNRPGRGDRFEARPPRSVSPRMDGVQSGHAAPPTLSLPAPRRRYRRKRGRRLNAEAELLARFPPELRERYLPVGVLGAGGQGAVIHARDLELGRDVAVKVLAVPGGGETHGRRLLREARILAGLRHPNIVEVYAAGEGAGGPHVVMELVDGPSLDRVRGDETDLVARMIEIAEGLEYMHRQGVLHRDVKPTNVVLHPAGRAVLIDFGLGAAPDRSTLTRDGMVVGTPCFLAPEIYAGAPFSPASDWYSWGASLFWVLERRPPFTGVDLLRAIKDGSLPPPTFLNLEEGDPRRRLIRRCLDPRPEARPGNLAELRAALQVSGRPPGSRDRTAPPAVRGVPVAPTLLALALLGGTVAWSTGIRRPPAPSRPPSPTAAPASEAPILPVPDDLPAEITTAIGRLDLEPGDPLAAALRSHAAASAAWGELLRDLEYAFQSGVGDGLPPEIWEMLGPEHDPLLAGKSPANRIQVAAALASNRPALARWLEPAAGAFHDWHRDLARAARRGGARGELAARLYIALERDLRVLHLSGLLEVDAQGYFDGIPATPAGQALALQLTAAFQGPLRRLRGEDEQVLRDRRVAHAIGILRAPPTTRLGDFLVGNAASHLGNVLVREAPDLSRLRQAWVEIGPVVARFPAAPRRDVLHLLGKAREARAEPLPAADDAWLDDLLAGSPRPGS